MREQIIVCAGKLFTEQGIRAVTMDAVAGGLTISKRTLYEHFTCKEELLSECLRLRLDQSGLLKTSDEGLLDELLNLYQGMQRIHLECVARFCGDLRRYYDPLYRELFGHVLDYAARCGDKVEAGIADGYLRKDVSRSMVYTAVSGYLVRLFVDVDHERSSIRTLLSPDNIPVFARGLSTIKGRAYIDQKIKQIKQ